MAIAANFKRYAEAAARQLVLPFVEAFELVMCEAPRIVRQALAWSRWKADEEKQAAPAPTPKPTGLFVRFSSWLKSITRRLFA